MRFNTKKSAAEPLSGEIDLMGRLKKATADAHQRLHIHPVTRLLLSPNLCCDYYIRMLQAFYGFHQPLEATVASCRPISRTGWIQQDLEFFGYNTNLPLCFELPKIRTTGELLGYWYVVEGSSLGNTVIYKHLQMNLGLSADRGARYAYAYGQDTGRNWNELKTRINSSQLSRQEQQHTVAMAVKVFTSLEQWLWICHRKSR